MKEEYQACPNCQTFCDPSIEICRKCNYSFPDQRILKFREIDELFDLNLRRKPPKPDFIAVHF